MLYTKKFDTPENDYTIPFGKANIVQEGDKITIVATSIMVLKALEAARELKKQGVLAEVIDLRTLVPLDRETVIASVKKTGRLLIVDEVHESFGISGEIAISIMKDVFYYLDAPIIRLGTADVPLPFSPALEFPLIPDEKAIREAVLQIVNP
jgi:pyruvate dehydrogenase E1 component beta subunit